MDSSRNALGLRRDQRARRRGDANRAARRHRDQSQHDRARGLYHRTCGLMVRWLGSLDDRRFEPGGFLRLVGGMDSFETTSDRGVSDRGLRLRLRSVGRIIVYRLAAGPNRSIGVAWFIAQWRRGERA